MGVSSVWQESTINLLDVQLTLAERHMYTIYLKPNDDVGSLGEYIN